MSEAILARARWIAGVWRPHLRWLPVLVFMTVLSTTVSLAYPLVFGHVLEEIRRLSLAQTRVDAQVHTLIGLLLAIGLARFLASFYPAFRALLNEKIERATRERFFGVVLGKGHRFFTRFRTGDVVTRLTDDISGYPKIAWFSCSGLFRAFDSTSRVVCCLGVMLWLDVSIALYSLLPVPFMMLLFLALEGRLREAVQDQREAASHTSAYLEATFSGISVVQAHNAEARLGDTLARHLEDRSTKEVRLARLWVLFSVFFMALNVVGQLVVVVVGGLRVLEGSMTLGDFFAFYLYLGLLLGPMMDLPNLFVTARQAFVCMDRLDELQAFDPEGELSKRRGAEPLSGFSELVVQGLHHTYPAQEEDSEPRPTLSGVDLTVRPGERVAVVGEVGAGKTTLLRLLGGALPVQGGDVLLGGKPLKAHRSRDLRSVIGRVPQTPILFSATIRENILLGRAEDPERLATALDLANMTDEVSALPDGVDHSLGLRGRGLSGGQRQRLTIARALYGSPELLLLDDITAALDAENEERFWQRLLQDSPGVTVLVVTHRDATARRMERTLVLEDGQLSERGRPEEGGDEPPYTPP